jgi:hypothetical protein
VGAAGQISVGSASAIAADRASKPGRAGIQACARCRRPRRSGRRRKSDRRTRGRPALTAHDTGDAVRPLRGSAGLAARRGAGWFSPSGRECVQRRCGCLDTNPIEVALHNGDGRGRSAATDVGDSGIECIECRRSHSPRARVVGRDLAVSRGRAVSRVGKTTSVHRDRRARRACPVPGRPWRTPPRTRCGRRRPD